ncbi:MAG: Glu/Leu/Phe/Val dehydrogenase dimerization domain-containing protein [Alphaproteobacteria bacterium]
MAALDQHEIAHDVDATPVRSRADDVTPSARDHGLFDGHERVMRWRDSKSGLNAVVAVHDRSIGPAVAPVRMAPFRTLGRAVGDALTRSALMTERAMLTGCTLGGGAVSIIGNPRTGRSPALFRALGRLADRLNGGVLLLPDAGLDVYDLDFAAMETPFVLGATPGGGGDLAVATAYGAYVALSATVRVRLGRSDLRGLSVAVHGVGRVGYALCALLARDQVHLLVADVDAEAATRAANDHGAAIVVAAALPRVRADVFVACAGPGSIDADNVGDVAARIVIAVADGTLASAHLVAVLAERGVVYVPESIAGAGALLNALGELDRDGYDHDRAFARVRTLAQTTIGVLDTAARERTAPAVAATSFAAAIASRRRRQLRLAAMTPAWAHA